MADGVRITAADPRLAGAIIEVPHPGRRLPDGSPKMYRLVLDDQGGVLVSETVWQRIEEIMGRDPAAPRFIVTGHVAAPPTITVTNERSERLVLRHFTGEGIRERISTLNNIHVK